MTKRTILIPLLIVFLLIVGNLCVVGNLCAQQQNTLPVGTIVLYAGDLSLPGNVTELNNAGWLMNRSGSPAESFRYGDLR